MSKEAGVRRIGTGWRPELGRYFVSLQLCNSRTQGLRDFVTQEFQTPFIISLYIFDPSRSFLSRVSKSTS